MSAGTAEIELARDDHVVHFYADESGLGQTVVRHLIAGGGQAAVGLVIATAEHRRCFEAGLAAAGIDVGAAVADGRLIWLDAAQTLERFMSDGAIDAEAFHRVVGGALRVAGEGVRPIRAYGEMVALLWNAGDVLGAIELEGLWNDLGRELCFSLLCAYHSESVAGGEHAEALREVCHLHSSVRSLEDCGHEAQPQDPAKAELSAQFPASFTAPGAARRFLIDGLRSWGCDTVLLDDAQLVLSELAANAVVHARTVFTVRVRREETGVLVSVHDFSPVLPILRDPGPMTPTGRGLRLVAILACDWGVEIAAPGKTVWARLSA
jgi:anti-sigma regulatory factor (Ser/Thr protein kinase)